MVVASRTPHDALFKWTFSVPERAAAEFRAVLPKEVLAVVDLSTLELCGSEFVDAALAHCYSDLLFQVRVAGKPGFVYVLFEHQSGPDQLMPLRLLGYLVRILELEVRAREKRKEPALPLPVVIPVVLHHGAAGWSKALSFEGLFPPELLQLPAVAAVVPRFEFLLDDLRGLTDAELRARALDQVTALTLWALRDARRPAEIVRTIHAWIGAMGELSRAPNGIEALGAIFRYISQVTDDGAAELVLQTLAEQEPHIEAAMTLAERWKAEGEARGRAEGERLVLLRQLTLKFGPLRDDVTARVASASEVELIRWSEAVLTAHSLDQVFSSS